MQYFVISSNPFRGAIIPNGRVNAVAVWWEGPDGNRVLTWFSRQYQQFEGLFTKNNSEAAGVNSLPIFLQTYSTAEYIPDAVLIYGTQSDNRPFLASELDFPEQWNKDFAFPNLRIATLDEFFGYMGTELRRFTSHDERRWGLWWGRDGGLQRPLCGTSPEGQGASFGCRNVCGARRGQFPDIRYPIELDNSIWQNLHFYTEHTWGAEGTWRRPEHDEANVLRRDKEAFSEDAAHEVDKMLRRGLSQLGVRLNLREPAVIVFNSLSWPRSGEVDVDINRGHGLVDLETGKPVELELVRRVPDEQYDRVRLRAHDVLNARLPVLWHRRWKFCRRGVRPRKFQCHQEAHIIGLPSIRNVAGSRAFTTRRSAKSWWMRAAPMLSINTCMPATAAKTRA